MQRPSPKLDAVYRRHVTERQGRRTYEESLAIRADFPSDWRDDLAPDLAIARAVNGLPPDS